MFLSRQQLALLFRIVEGLQNSKQKSNFLLEIARQYPLDASSRNQIVEAALQNVQLNRIQNFVSVWLELDQNDDFVPTEDLKKLDGNHISQVFEVVCQLYALDQEHPLSSKIQEQQQNMKDFCMNIPIQSVWLIQEIVSVCRRFRDSHQNDDLQSLFLHIDQTKETILTQS